MIVSWKWLKDYVKLDMPVEELTTRLTMAGLNLEGIENVQDDLAIDLEVTSNRPDCLGHIGVAREISVVYDQKLAVPDPRPATVSERTASATSVEIECDDLCPRYFARVIRGVRVGPSPDWLQERLATVGVAAINNIVDITNYVLLECSQPLHAFDFDKLKGGRILVRRAGKGETITAIDQRDYQLDGQMCVIADAQRPVAIGGVMGGLDTEISDSTVNVLIETAEFAPLSIRNTARRLNLHSESSYRFERGVDPQGLDWASRRCCQLILELAGGELLDEPVLAGRPPQDKRLPMTLRFDQLRRILGIEIGGTEAVRILEDLGLQRIGESSAGSATFLPPSWRRDLDREADLVEEVARIHGYEHIPADVPVPLSLSAKTRRERVADTVRDVLTACGFYEAVTMSLLSDELCELFTPRGERPRIRVEHSFRKHENVLRQTLVPSLLVSRRENERHGNDNAQLFEIARVYLKGAPNEPEEQSEPPMIALVTGRPFAELKGIVEALAARLNRRASMTTQPSKLAQFAPGRGADLFLNGAHWGWLGELDRTVTDKLDLRDSVTVAELSLPVLESIAELTPTFTPLPLYPAVERDLNFVLDEAVTWRDLQDVCRDAAGPLLDSIRFGGQYRGKQIPSGKKSYLIRIGYRSPERTLTTEEVDEIERNIVAACQQQLGAALR